MIAGMPTATLSRLGTLRPLRRQNRCDRQNPGHTAYRCFRHFAQRFQFRPPFGLDLNRKSDIAVLDDKSRYHAEGNDVRPLIGVGDPFQRFEDFILGNRRHA